MTWQSQRRNAEELDVFCNLATGSNWETRSGSTLKMNSWTLPEQKNTCGGHRPLRFLFFSLPGMNLYMIDSIGAVSVNRKHDDDSLAYKYTVYSKKNKWWSRSINMTINLQSSWTAQQNTRSELNWLLGLAANEWIISHIRPSVVSWGQPPCVTRSFTLKDFGHGFFSIGRFSTMFH